VIILKIEHEITLYTLLIKVGKIVIQKTLEKCIFISKDLHDQDRVRTICSAHQNRKTAIQKNSCKQIPSTATLIVKPLAFHENIHDILSSASLLHPMRRTYQAFYPQKS
jgi:hypothetical protein